MLQKKTALPAQFSMSFTYIDYEVLYIMVYIKLHIGKDMDNGHDVCDVLYYNTVTWCNYIDYTITQYPGYPMNVYEELLIYHKQKLNWKRVSMDGSDSIFSMVYIKNDIIESSTY